MHDCLLIAEMQAKIIAYAIQSDRGHQTVAALARTCKALVEPCLDVLWHRQERGLGPLMKTLPPDLWEVSYGSLSFTRQFAWSDWTRFNYYARRIQEISVGINAFADKHGNGHIFRHNIVPLDETSIDARALDMMSPSGVPLLCNLRQLAFSDDPESMKVARFLLGPAIRTIHLDFISDIFTVSDATTFFAILRNKCPFLEHLEFCGISEKLCPTVSQFVCGWENLQTLVGNQSHCVTDETMIIHLALLPTLSKLKLNIGHNSLPLGFPPQPFAALRHLNLFTFNIRLITDWLRSYHLLPLQSLALIFHSPISMSPTELMHVIRDHCAHSCLTQLVLHNDTPVPGSSFEPDMLMPLLAFTKLTIVEITYDSQRINDTVLGEMAKAWPQLERLTLGSKMEANNNSKMTLAGLVPLARYCPKLELIWLPFDASNIERPGREFRNRQLTELGIGYSNIKDVTAVAEFLSDIFPNLCTVYWPAHSRTDREKWPEVLKMLDIWRREGG